MHENLEPAAAAEPRMSNRALNLTWGKAPSPTSQLVLARLADRAADPSLSCYPSVQNLSADTLLGKSTVRRALRELEVANLIRCEMRENQSTLYHVLIPPAAIIDDHPPSAPPLAAGAPPARSERTPRPDRADPPPAAGAITFSEPSGEPSRESPPPKAAVARTMEAKGARLPDDWEPSGDDRAFAWSLGCDPQAVAMRFRDYWRALPGAKGRKSDWPATWRNWCRREAERPASRSPPSRRTTNADHLAALGLAPDGSPLPQFNTESRPA